MRRLGVDPGARRIGLALSDPELAIAYPYKTISHAGGDEGARLVADEIKSEAVVEVVVGLPLRLDGSEGEAARRARLFARQIEEASGVPVVMWDERLSTGQAQRALTEMGVRSRKGRQVVDQMAATLLLQSYLDARSHSKCQERDPGARLASEVGRATGPDGDDGDAGED